MYFQYKSSSNKMQQIDTPTAHDYRNIWGQNGGMSQKRLGVTVILSLQQTWWTPNPETLSPTLLLQRLIEAAHGTNYYPSLLSLNQADLMSGCFCAHRLENTHGHQTTVQIWRTVVWLMSAIWRKQLHPCFWYWGIRNLLTSEDLCLCLSHLQWTLITLNHFLLDYLHGEHRSERLGHSADTNEEH